MPNFITIKKLKELTNGIIKIKPLYNNISDDYTPTYRELKEGKFFNRFVDNCSPNLIVVGVKINGTYNDCYTVDEDDVELIYPRLNDISIDKVNDIPPCGINLQLSAVARFDVITKNVKSEEKSIGKKCSPINPFWRSSNELIKINGTAIIADTNNLDKQIITTLSASYAYSGVSKSDAVLVKQDPNVIGDWEIENEETDKIVLSITPDYINNKGGQSQIRVVRFYTKNWMKQDSCGKVMETSATTCHLDDVTSCCQYDNSNPEHFVRNLNVITTKKQSFNSNEQNAIFTAHYKEFTSEATITQQKGGNITYTYDLSFLETDNEKLNKILDTSIPTEIKIPLISNKNMLIDDVYHSSIIYENLTLINNNTWCKATIDDRGEDMVLIVKVIEPNHNRKQQRIATFKIINEEGDNKEIELTVVQPNSFIVESVWELYMSGGGQFTNETIKEARIEFKPIKKDIYEDGTWDVYNVLDNDIRVTYDSQSTNPNILGGGVLKHRNFNGLHDMKPKYVNNTEINDVSLNIYGFIEDAYGDILAEGKSTNITLLGVVVPTVTYELTFEDKNINNELIWDYNTLTEQIINVKSFKHSYVNGVKTKTEELNVKLKPKTTWGNDFFIILKEKTIDAKPLFFNQSKDDIINEYCVIQEESGNEINITLTQQPLILKKEYNVIVKIHKNTIDENVWIEDGGLLILTSENDDVDKITLSSGWIYPCIEDNSDIIYNGIVKLYEDMKYECTIKNIIYNTNACDGDDKNIKYENQYFNIITNDNDIELIFEL